MDVTNESVHTSDDVDIGDIEAINRDFIVVKRGIIRVHYYYIPVSKVEGWDGHVVWLKIPEEEVEKKYHVDKSPDPSEYYIKGFSYDKSAPFTTAYFPELPVISAKYNQEKKSKSIASPKIQKESRVYECPLCNKRFQTEDELSTHVAANH